MSYLLKPTKGSTHSKKRIGRGNASGQGRTAGKGHKGYKSRSGTKAKLHFEGGQTPLMRRLPKRGMKIFSKSRRYKKTYQIINLDMIVSLNILKVDADVLFKKGMISNKDIPIKILSNGEIKEKIEFSFEMYSKTAIEKIEKAGGKVNYI